jgi:hypothetical protein
MRHREYRCVQSSHLLVTYCIVLHTCALARAAPAKQSLGATRAGRSPRLLKNVRVPHLFVLLKILLGSEDSGDGPVTGRLNGWAITMVRPIKSNQYGFDSFSLQKFRSRFLQKRTKQNPRHIPLPQVSILAYSTVFPMRSSLVSFESNESPRSSNSRMPMAKFTQRLIRLFLARCVGLCCYY